MQSFSGLFVRMRLDAQRLLDRKYFEQKGEMAVCRIESRDDALADQLRMRFEVISEEEAAFFQFRG